MKKRIIALLVASILSVSGSTLFVSANDSQRIFHELESEASACLTSQSDGIEDAETLAIVNEFENYCKDNSLPVNFDSLELFAQNYSLCQLHSTDSSNSTNETITVAVVRHYALIAARDAGYLGYDMVEETLSHACDDSPSKLTWSAGSSFSDEIKTSSEYASLVANIKSSLHNETGTYWSKSGNLSLNSPLDVYLSLHAVKYTAAAEKVNGTWTIYLRFSDTYNFESQIYQNSGVNPLVTFANEFGAQAQNLGAISPYSILAYTQESL